MNKSLGTKVLIRPIELRKIFSYVCESAAFSVCLSGQTSLHALFVLTVWTIMSECAGKLNTLL